MSNVRVISLDELKQWIDERRDFALLDTQPQEYFDQCHLPNARNACVYEVTFLDQVRSVTDDKGKAKGKAIVLYGSSARSKASSVAAVKLAEAGYANLYDFQGGIADWRDAGFPIESTSSPKKPPKLEDRAYAVDAANSVIEWVGRNLANKHTGTLKIAMGEIKVAQGEVAGGHFTIDMHSIADSDIPDKSYAQVLVNHLASDDFFEVARYPTALFVIDRALPIAGATPGLPNYTVAGKLTLKGVEREVRFSSLIGSTDDRELVAQAHFDFDRTLWNVLYGSGKFFENLGKHLVNDLVSLQLKIVAR